MKYYVLVIDYQLVEDRFVLTPLEATDEEAAWQEIEDSYQSNNSHEVLLSEDDCVILRKCFNDLWGGCNK